MPNMKEVCRTLDGMQKSISEAFSRIDQIMKLVQAGQFFQGGGAGSAASAPPSAATPGTDPAASPTPPSPPPQSSKREGDLPEIVPDYLMGLGKKRSKNRFHPEEVVEEREGELIDRLRDEAFEERYQYDIDYIGLSPVPVQSKKSAAIFQQMIEQMVNQAISQAANSAAGKATAGGGGNTAGGGPGSGGAAPPPGPPGAPGIPGAPGTPGQAGPQGAPGTPAAIPSAIVSFVNNAISKSAFNMLSSVFGRRIANMVTPDAAHVADWLFMAQNVKWIDNGVASGINKALAQKVQQGLLTQAEAGAAKGFMATEAVGAQVAGGALIGLFIFQNIPKIASMLRDNVDFITGISDALFDTKTGKLMAYLDGIVASLNSISGALKVTGQFAEGIGVFGMETDLGEVGTVYDRVRAVEASNERIKEAGERYVRRKRNQVAAELAGEGFDKMIDSLVKGLGFR
jgi:hypothetical protein